MLLTTEQSDNLGMYIACDSLRLEDVGFEQLVNEQRQRSDFHPQGEDAMPQGSQAIEPSQGERCQRYPLHSTLDRPATNRNHATKPTQISRQVRRLPSRRTLGLRKEGLLDGPPLSITQEAQALDPKPVHQPNGGCPSTSAALESSWTIRSLGSMMRQSGWLLKRRCNSAKLSKGSSR
jgi:hypothetical protein